MSQKPPAKPVVMTKARIRWLAVFGAAIIWCSRSVSGLWFGNSLSQAVSSGAGGALGGLIGWTIYHVVSRRNEGLIVFLAMGCGMPIRDISHPFWVALFIALFGAVPVALIMGLLTRGPKEGVIDTDTTDPLYDPEMDQPRETSPAHGRT